MNKEQEWLAAQKGWKLTSINGISYVFEESNCDYTYEFVYFDKGKKNSMLLSIRLKTKI